MNGSRIPFHMRVLWRVMTAAERFAQWCRLLWLRHHETRGAVLPGADDTTPAERPGPSMSVDDGER